MIKEAYLNQTSLRTFIDPEEITGMVKYLLSPIATKVSGQAISIDGHTESLSQIRTKEDNNEWKQFGMNLLGKQSKS